jgi:hypothetical protein
MGSRLIVALSLAMAGFLPFSFLALKIPRGE